MTDGLQNCPFCGSDDIVPSKSRVDDEPRPFRDATRCVNCGASAVDNEHWNKREPHVVKQVFGTDLQQAILALQAANSQMAVLSGSLLERLPK